MEEDKAKMEESRDIFNPFLHAGRLACQKENHDIDLENNKSQTENMKLSTILRGDASSSSKVVALGDLHLNANTNPALDQANRSTPNSYSYLPGNFDGVMVDAEDRKSVV